MKRETRESRLPDPPVDKHKEAIEWLHSYLRLVVRIYRDHLARLEREGGAGASDGSRYPQRPLDDSGEDGIVGTPQDGPNSPPT